jgi:hypothetical protein
MPSGYSVFRVPPDAPANAQSISLPTVRRNVVERCVNRLKQWHGIATRYEKWAVNYRTAVVIAGLMI